MFKRNNLMATVCLFSMAAGSPALSNAQATQILEEYFGVLDSTQLEMAVGDKDDALRYTQWNNITIKSEDGAAQIAIQWVKVSKNLLGGFELTYAEKIDGAFQSPDSEIVEPIQFVIESKGASADIGGAEGERDFQSKFDEVIFRTMDNGTINILMKMTDGESQQRLISGQNGSSAGSFAITEMEIGYAMDIEGQSIIYSSNLNGLSGTSKLPIYEKTDDEEPAIIFDPSRDVGFDYSVSSGTTTMAASSEVGPVEINGSFADGTGFFGIQDSFAKLSGTTNNIDYNVSAPAMGLPPMQLNIDQTIANISIPLDNTDQTKPTDLKLAITGLTVSEQVWALFDPAALLPRDGVDLDIDIQAGMLWLSKIADIDFVNKSEAPPVTFENAEIKALNLKVAGAELQSSGSVNIDNSQFPPVPDGSFNISLKGAKGLLNNLAELGLVPTQNAMMIHGMSGMFFKPGGDGDDHLVSTIEMAKDGHIKANGVPIK